MTFQQLKQKIITLLKHAYVKSPINFSTITGLRYPGIPRLKGNFLLGRLTTLFKENGTLENVIQAGHLAEQHPNGMCYFWLGTKLSLLITRPEDIQALKVKYEKKLSRDVPLMRKAVGASIFTDDRETWQKKREACNKVLGHTAVDKLTPRMEQVIYSYIDSLKNYDHQPVELRTFFFNMVVDTVTINLMGCPAKLLHANPQPIQVDKLTDLSHFLSESLHEVFQFHNIFKCMLPGFIRKLFFRNADDFETVKNKMQDRYYQLFLSPNRTNILDTQNLIKEIWDINHAKNHSNDDYHDPEILGDGLILLGAGVATTVATLEFVIKLLAAHPEKAENLRAEINEHIKGNEVTLEAIKQMSYLEMVIKETMRLYPPAPLFMPREIDADIEINGVPLFKGDAPIFSPYVVHRSKEHWEHPEEFIPERFSKDNQHNINVHAYLPFSIGPRFCAGQQFAMQEMKIILIVLYNKYHLDIENNSFELTLKQGGLAAAIPPVARLHRLVKTNLS